MKWLGTNTCLFFVRPLIWPCILRKLSTILAVTINIPSAVSYETAVAWCLNRLSGLIRSVRNAKHSCCYYVKNWSNLKCWCDFAMNPVALVALARIFTSVNKLWQLPNRMKAGCVLVGERPASDGQDEVQGKRRMARTERLEPLVKIVRASPFHCASTSPVDLLTRTAGMRMQGMVPRLRGSVPGGLGVNKLAASLLVASKRITGKVSGLINAFTGVQTNNYWSSSSNVNNPQNAWIVNLYNGNVNTNNKTNNNYVWPVRAGE